MDYKRVLQALERAKAAGLSGDDALAAAFEENSHDRCPLTGRLMLRALTLYLIIVGHRKRTMGKPTGFMEYHRELPADREPLERIKDWNEFHLHMPEENLRTQGARCMDCGIPVLPHRRADQRHGQRLSDQQPDPRVERPGLPRSLAPGAGPAAQDQQLPRVHRPGLPGPLRRVLHPGHQRPAGHHQEHRGQHCRARLGRRAGSSPTRPQSAPARRWPWSAPALPVCRPLPSSTRPATGHGLRAGRSARRPADVRHPQHEAGQARGGAAPHRADGGGRDQLRLQHRGRRQRITRRRSCAASSMPWSWPPAPPCRATCRSKGAA